MMWKSLWTRSRDGFQILNINISAIHVLRVAYINSFLMCTDRQTPHVDIEREREELNIQKTNIRRENRAHVNR